MRDRLGNNGSSEGFNIGDEVSVLWPKDGRNYEGVVKQVRTRRNVNQYHVVYTDQSDEKDVNESRMRLLSPEQPPPVEGTTHPFLFCFSSPRITNPHTHTTTHSLSACVRSVALSVISPPEGDSTSGKQEEKEPEERDMEDGVDRLEDADGPPSDLDGEFAEGNGLPFDGDDNDPGTGESKKKRKRRCGLRKSMNQKKQDPIKKKRGKKKPG